jgi:hypothetical protein
VSNIYIVPQNQLRVFSFTFYTAFSFTKLTAAKTSYITNMVGYEAGRLGGWEGFVYSASAVIWAHQIATGGDFCVTASLRRSWIVCDCGRGFCLTLFGWLGKH